jgi:hypothetical protein
MAVIKEDGREEVRKVVWYEPRALLAELRERQAARNEARAAAGVTEIWRQLDELADRLTTLRAAIAGSRPQTLRGALAILDLYDEERKEFDAEDMIAPVAAFLREIAGEGVQS